ncbi:hypothetical protein HDR58_09790 [bacterium]|nr:hypothetical protein [bacterium]
MLEKISSINYERCYPKRLKKLFETHINMRTYNDFIPKMERAVVGNIPIEIIKIFPKSDRGERIKQFQEVLSQTAISLRSTYHKIKNADDFSFVDCNYRPSKHVKKIAKKGENVLNRELAKMFGTDVMRAKLEYVGNGSFKNVFKLSLLDNDGNKIMHDKALQVYHQLNEGHSYYSMIHNTYAEANFWTFLKRVAGHKLDNTQFTKHYISDLHSGYCLTEFIDDKIPKTTKQLDICGLFEFRIPHDKAYNPKIMGKEYDGGGYEIDEEFTSNKILIRYSKQLYYSMGKQFKDVVMKLENLVQNPKTPYRNEIQKLLDTYDWEI